MKQSFVMPLLACICGHELTGVHVQYSHDPGVRTLRNGDPGYPETTEIVFEEGFPDPAICPGCNRVWEDSDIARFEEQVMENLPEPEDAWYYEELEEDE